MRNSSIYKTANDRSDLYLAVEMATSRVSVGFSTPNAITGLLVVLGQVSAIHWSG